MLTINATVISALVDIYTSSQIDELTNTVAGYNGENDLYKTTATSDDICTNLNKTIVERFYENATLDSMSQLIPICAVAHHNIESIDEITVTAHKIPSISRILDKVDKEKLLDIGKNPDMYDGINSIAKDLQKVLHIDGKTVHKEFKYVARNLHSKLTANPDKATYCNKFDKAGFFKDISNAMHIVSTRLVKYTDKTETTESLDDVSIKLEKA